MSRQEHRENLCDFGLRVQFSDKIQVHNFKIKHDKSDSTTI